MSPGEFFALNDHDKTTVIDLTQYYGQSQSA